MHSGPSRRRSNGSSTDSGAATGGSVVSPPGWPWSWLWRWSRVSSRSVSSGGRSRETRASAAAALEADANRVAALALNTEDAQLSLLLAVAAERLAPGVVTDRSLSSALAARAELIATATTTTSAATPASSLGDLASAGSRVYALDDRHVLHVFTTGLRPLGTVDLGNGRIDRGPARLTAAANLVAAAAGPGQTPAIKLVDALSLQPAGLALERLPQKNVRVDSLDLSADGRTLSAALATPDGEVVMAWELPSGELLGPPIRAEEDTAVRVSDDGRTLFTSNPMNAYDVKTGRLAWHAPRAAGLDVHEGHVAVPAEDGSRVQILDASDGRTIRTLTGNQGAVVDLAFSPNGATLAATVERRDRHRVGRGVGPDRTPPPDGRRAGHRVLRLRRHGLHGRKPAGFAARLGPAGPTQFPDPARARRVPAPLRGLGAGQFGRLVGVDVQDGAREPRAQVGKPPDRTARSTWSLRAETGAASAPGTRMRAATCTPTAAAS